MELTPIAPLQLYEEVLSLKHIKGALTQHYEALVSMKRILSEEGISLIGNSISPAINECLSMLYSIELHLINCDVYISLALENKVLASDPDFLFQLGSLKILSRELQKKAKQLNFIEAEDLVAA